MVPTLRLPWRLSEKPLLAVRLLPFAPRVLMGESYSAFQPTQKRPQTFSSNNYSVTPYTLIPNGTQSLAHDDDG